MSTWESSWHLTSLLVSADVEEEKLSNESEALQWERGKREGKSDDWNVFVVTESTRTGAKKTEWQWQRFTLQDSRVGNDTILNYYYFQMTKHDVTNRLPASQTRKNIKKKKENLVETWEQKKSCENFSSRSVFVSSLFLCALPNVTTSLKSSSWCIMKKWIQTSPQLIRAVQKKLKHFEIFLCKSKAWWLNSSHRSSLSRRTVRF